MIALDCSDVIPVSNYGYVIGKEKIYVLKYKYSHAFVSAIVFQEKLSKYSLNITDISLDTTNYELSKFIDNMPLIQISRVKVPEKVNFLYNIFINTTNKKELHLLYFILKNVYGVDGSEEIDINIPRLKTASDLLILLRKNIGVSCE